MIEDNDDEMRASFLRAVERVHSSALKLKRWASPLRTECEETAQLARRCGEAVREI